MHNRALHDTLAAFVEEAAWQLAEEVAAGAEIPFELIEQGRASRAALLLSPADRPLHRRATSACSSGSRPTRRPRRASTALPNLAGYLHRARAPHAGRRPRAAQGDAALEAFITALWGDATEFVYEPRALRPVYAELEEAVYDGCSLSRRARPGRGPRDRVRRGRARRRPRRSCAARRSASTPDRTARRRLRDRRGPAPRGRAGRVARRSSRPAAGCAGCRPRCGCGTTPSRSLGPIAWARTDGGPWMSVPLAHRPAAHGRRLPARRPRRRTRCARSARSSPAAPRARASWRGRCGASSSAASARSPGGAHRLAARGARAARRRRRARRRAACPSASPRSAPRPSSARAGRARLRDAASLERAAIAGRVRARARGRDARRGPRQLRARGPARRALRPPRPRAAHARRRACSTSSPPSRPPSSGGS